MCSRIINFVWLSFTNADAVDIAAKLVVPSCISAVPLGSTTGSDIVIMHCYKFWRLISIKL